MWKEKLGGYLIDVSKYVLTGVVIASLFKDMGDNRYLIYGIGILVAGFTLLSGLYFERISSFTLSNFSVSIFIKTHFDIALTIMFPCSS